MRRWRSPRIREWRPFLVAVIGLFGLGLGEIFVTVEQGLRLEGVQARVTFRDVWTSVRRMPRYGVALIRSTVIGCRMGITPGGPVPALVRDKVGSSCLLGASAVDLRRPPSGAKARQ